MRTVLVALRCGLLLLPTPTSAFVRIMPSPTTPTLASSTDDLLPAQQQLTLDGEPLRQDIEVVSNILLVKVKDTLTATSGGILLPDQSKERPTEGLVLKAGPGRIHPHTGVLITNPIQEGMSVL